ncbi:MAG TPA: hypothetical protein VJM08_17785 [Anaerolineales bacterium]|nr:hypothetical protein [Anaerolineales bacterium]
MKYLTPAPDHVTISDPKGIHRGPQALIELVDIDPEKVGERPGDLARPNKDGLGLVGGRDGFAPDAVCQVHEVLRGDPEPMENLLELGLLVAMVIGIPIHGRPPSVWALFTGSEEINLFVFPSIDAVPSSTLFAVTGTARIVGIFNTIIDTSLIINALPHMGVGSSKRDKRKIDEG